MMLVVFDVDGTLTDTAAVDATVFEETFRAVFGVPLPSTDWTTYALPTDEGIAREALLRAGLDPERLPAFKRRFVGALCLALGRATVSQVPGAAALLERLAASGHGFVFATGAWEESARAKLAAARIEASGRVLVGSDRLPARDAIVIEAVRRAPAADRIVFVGDGEWDVATARELGLPFLGVDRGATGRLERAGARETLADYRDTEAALAALLRARVPVPSALD